MSSMAKTFRGFISRDVLERANLFAAQESVLWLLRWRILETGLDCSSFRISKKMLNSINYINCSYLSLTNNRDYIFFLINKFFKGGHHCNGPKSKGVFGNLLKANRVMNLF